MDVEQAREIAERLLAADLPQRWAHTQGVARRARELASRVGDQADLLEAAAWLHDIGYAPAIARSGFHPLDGARYLRDIVGAEREIVLLVAHHSGARFEAEERGLADVLLAEFGQPPEGLVLRALTAGDMSTSKAGKPIDPSRRIAEILDRYSTDSPVHRAVQRARPLLMQSI